MRIGAVGAAAALVTTGLVIGQASADQAPQRVLQSVNVDLGADGTLHAITGVNVRKTDGETAPTSDQADYDPTKTSSQLPVRVVTAYRAGDRTGTDLGDIKGYSGPLRIDITVQNTTVHPEKVAYDVDGSRRSQYALVGVPLTVVASADLGKGAVDSVVTRSDAGGAVTNGVLSQDRSGNAQVQWASLLAPPQLAPSVTFTLVENAHDFAMPSFDLSVQPGLATDSSMQSLLQSAFSDDGSSRLQLETETIGLISQVTSVLADAGTQLGEVRSQLDFSAGQLGSRTIGDLSSSTQTVAGNTKALSGELDALGVHLGDALRTSRDAAVGEMRTTVDSVSRLLGDTRQRPAAPVLSGSGCQTTVAKARGADTVYGQLTQVATLLDGLKHATNSCQELIQAKLVKTVGETDAQGDAVCPPDAQNAICTINAAGDALTALVSSLAASQKAAVTALDTDDLLSTTNTQLAHLEAEVTTLQSDANSMVTPNNQGHNQVTDDTVAILGDLNTEVQGVRDSLTGSGSITSVVDTIHQTAVDNLAELQGSGGDPAGSVIQENADLAATICQLQQNNSLSNADAQTLLQFSTGKSCDSTPTDLGAPKGYSAPLATRLDQQVTGWTAVEAASSPTGDAYTAIFGDKGIDAKLKQVQADINTAIDNAKNQQQPQIGKLLDEITKLYYSDATPGTTDCTKTLGDFKDPVNELAFAVTQMTDCKKAKITDAITEAFSDARSKVTAQAGQVHDQLASVNDSRVYSDGQLESLFGQATGGLDDGATTITHDGAKA
ncbi:MAG: hypothetical protein ACXV2G_07690, partial [Actinomycetes bacterium]